MSRTEFQDRSFWNRVRESVFIKLLFGEANLPASKEEIEKMVLDFDFYLKSYSDDEASCESYEDISISEMNYLLGLTFGEGTIKVRNAEFYNSVFSHLS